MSLQEMNKAIVIAANICTKVASGVSLRSLERNRDRILIGVRLLRVSLLVVNRFIALRHLRRIFIQSGSRSSFLWILRRTLLHYQ